jgi:hypothetical protein
VVHEVIGGLPTWLAWGLGIGLALSCGVACLFYVGDRLFPSAQSGGRSVSGDRRREAEIRSYLDAIGERYVEGHPVAGHDVEFYLPGRDVAITFDPRAFYEVGATSTHAVLVEHEMPGAHLGRRLPFETPEVSDDDEEDEAVGPGDRADGDGEVDGAYAVLGLAPGADEGRVREAYRERVKEVHPDHGGSREAFRRVQDAYATVRRT